MSLRLGSSRLYFCVQARWLAFVRGPGSDAKQAVERSRSRDCTPPVERHCVGRKSKPAEAMAVKTSHSLMLSAIYCVVFPEFLSAAVTGCPPVGYDVATLGQLRERHFDIANTAERQTFARNLLACLNVPDPNLRDSIAYEAYATWRHNKSLDPV